MIDLYLENMNSLYKEKVKQLQDEVFTRKGYDLFINKDISLLEALKGFKIELIHLDDRKILIKNDMLISSSCSHTEAQYQDSLL